MNNRWKIKLILAVVLPCTVLQAGAMTVAQGWATTFMAPVAGVKSRVITWWQQQSKATKWVCGLAALGLVVDSYRWARNLLNANSVCSFQITREQADEIKKQNAERGSNGLPEGTLYYRDVHGQEFSDLRRVDNPEFVQQYGHLLPVACPSSMGMPDPLPLSAYGNNVQRSHTPVRVPPSVLQAEHEAATRAVMERERSRREVARWQASRRTRTYLR